MSGYSKALKQLVVLKLCRPNYLVNNECSMLKKYDKIACKCIYISEEDRILLLEKLEPGYNINQIKNREERIKCFAQLMKKTVIEIDDKKYVTYEERIKKGFLSATENRQKYGETAELVSIAYEYYKEIQNLKLKKYLLHGDLGVGNIIKSGNIWKVIDPQGVIAEEIFEVIKFVRSEIENDENVTQAIAETVEGLSKLIPYSKGVIAKVTFIELIRVNCWRIGENDIGEYVNKNLILAKEVLKYINSI